jgi:hypothetical protein
LAINGCKGLYPLHSSERCWRKPNISLIYQSCALALGTIKISSRVHSWVKRRFRSITLIPNRRSWDQDIAVSALDSLALCSRNHGHKPFAFGLEQGVSLSSIIRVHQTSPQSGARPSKDSPPLLQPAKHGAHLLQISPEKSNPAGTGIPSLLSSTRKAYCVFRNTNSSI